MKNLIKTLITTASLLPCVAFAQTAEIDSTETKKTIQKIGERFQLNLLYRNSINYGAQIVDGAKSLNVNVDEARFEVMGDIKPNLSYRFRYRMSRSPQSTSADAANNALDIAYVQYKFANNSMEVIFGKQGSLFGSYEFYTNPTFEYLYTDMVNSITNIFPTAATLKTYVNDKNAFSLQVYNTVNNRFEAHNANLGIANPTGIEASKIPLGANLTWYGSFAENKFTTMYSVGLNSYAKGNAGTNFALGHQYKAGKIWAYLDLVQANLPVDYTGLSNNTINAYYETATLARDIIYRTAVVRFDYLFAPKWNISLKGFVESASKKNDANFGNNFRNNIGYVSALEYKPFEDQSLKFFINYVGEQTTYKNAASTVTPNYQFNNFSLGFLWYVNPFKL